MKKLILAAALGALVFQSCKKDDNSTTSGSLVGNWKMTMYAADSNNDGMMQTSEQHILDTANYGYLQASSTIMKDSLSLDGGKLTLTYTYTFQNDTVYSNGFAGNEAMFGVTKLDGSSLNTVEPGGTGYPMVWRNYVRQ